MKLVTHVLHLLAVVVALAFTVKFALRVDAAGDLPRLDRIETLVIAVIGWVIAIYARMPKVEE